MLRTGGALDRTGGLAGYWAGLVMQIQEWRIKKTGGVLQRTGGAPDRSGGALYRSGGALQRLAGHWERLAVHWTGLALHCGGLVLHGYRTYGGTLSAVRIVH